MIHNLFDEYRFFPKYPEKELQVTACLFGGIIAHNVLSNIRLGIAPGPRCLIPTLFKWLPVVHP
jgi:CCR4-NOT transcription complex subunit 1